MDSLQKYLNEKGIFLREEDHLCCYDPAMWLEEKTILEILNLINGDKKLLEYWPQKPVGNGPWSWPLSLLSSEQVAILKKRFWKIKKVVVYKIDEVNLTPFLNDKNYLVNFLKNKSQLFIYNCQDKEIHQTYYIEDLKNIADFYEVIEDFFGKFVLLDVEEDTIFVPSTDGAYGSYSLAYEQLGKKGCRNYSCVLKCPVFSLDDHWKNLTYKIELVVNSLTSEVTDIIIYDMDNQILARLNNEGEFIEL